LSEVEAQLLHLNDRKQLLLERIGRQKDAILLKKNHLLTSRDWSSTGMSAFEVLTLVLMQIQFL
jgi:hypothetical protein